MKLSDRVRTLLGRTRRSASSPSARSPHEREGITAAKAWQRPGGPIDPGFVA